MLSGGALRVLAQITILIWATPVAFMATSYAALHPSRPQSPLALLLTLASALPMMMAFLLLMSPTSVPLLVALHLSGAILLTLWLLFLVRLTRQGTALRARVMGFSAVWLPVVWVATAFSFILPDLFWAMDQGREIPSGLWYLGAVWIVGLLAFAPRMRSLMRAFIHPGPLTEAVDQHEALSARLGLPITQTPSGLQAMGRRDGIEISVVLDEARTPPWLFFDIIDTRVPGTLTLRRAGASMAINGAPLRDPLLKGVVSVQGAPPDILDAVLRGSHEDLMPIFHGCEQAELMDQRLWFSREASFDSPDEAADTIHELLESATRLMVRLRTVRPALQSWRQSGASAMRAKTTE